MFQWLQKLSRQDRWLKRDVMYPSNMALISQNTILSPPKMTASLKSRLKEAKMVGGD
jgi:hypothetical protein